ncbi:MAG: ribonuclease HII [Alphaproteobacteria bacterium]|nr:ribonuclease HII [Alphaproteobacteria bacterium]MBL0717766.1 ribonuclease HII [Alphaproteobacteria bacterium]
MSDNLKLIDFDQNVFDDGYNFVCGIDEVGRGTLAGPVVASTFLIDKYAFDKIIRSPIAGIVDDSKKVSKSNREKIYNFVQSFIEENSGHCIYKNSTVEAEVIDDINILQASLLAMKQSLQSCTDNIKYNKLKCLVDGNKMWDDNVGIDFDTVIKGDQNSFLIAIASIIAKVSRDKIMVDLHEQYPQFDWNKNKGYGTKNHMEVIKKMGFSRYHRKSFQPIKDLIKKIEIKSL